MRDIQLLSENIISINRTNKMTLPGSSYLLEGQGLPLILRPPFPKLPVNLNDLDPRGDIVLKFELEPESYRDESVTATNRIEIRSQEDADLFLEKERLVREDKAARSILAILAKMQEKNSS